MPVELLLPPRRGPVELDELASWCSRGRPAPPFDPSVTGACASLSQLIMRDRQARAYPELTALAYWIRQAEIARLREEFLRLGRADRLLAPRGTVFHLPPRNVDTMFVYSWLLSALTGNRNVIRLSPLRSESTDVLLRLFGQALGAAASPAAESTLVVSYGHEEAPTALLSSLCDVRVIWGGDQTVAAIRRSPLPPHARELTFPDRYSLSALRAGAYLELSAEDRTRLADQFFNDCFWFDQMACSSPRLTIWCGAPGPCRDASADFFPRVATCAARRQYVVPAATSMRKLVFSASAAIERPVSACRRLTELTVLTLDTLAGFDRAHCGGGLFFEVQLEQLATLAPALGRKDQTLTTFGFEEEELRQFAGLLNGGAIDRIVPIGQALQFGRFWDGLDLLQEFCRHIHLDIRAPDGRASVISGSVTKAQ
jgi:Acyl-CoA reductase (LuxC)